MKEKDFPLHMQGLRGEEVGEKRGKAEADTEIVKTKNADCFMHGRLRDSMDCVKDMREKTRNMRRSRLLISYFCLLLARLVGKRRKKNYLRFLSLSLCPKRNSIFSPSKQSSRTTPISIHLSIRLFVCLSSYAVLQMKWKRQLFFLQRPLPLISIRLVLLLMVGRFVHIGWPEGWLVLERGAVLASPAS